MLQLPPPLEQLSAPPPLSSALRAASRASSYSQTAREASPAFGQASGWSPGTGFFSCLLRMTLANGQKRCRSAFTFSRRSLLASVVTVMSRNSAGRADSESRHPLTWLFCRPQPAHSCGRPSHLDGHGRTVRSAAPKGYADGERRMPIGAVAPRHLMAEHARRSA